MKRLYTFLTFIWAGFFFVLDAQVIKVDAVSITVEDMNRELFFFRDVLEFKLIHDSMYSDPSYLSIYGASQDTLRIVTMQLGDESIRLLHFNRKGRTYPPDSKSNDLWFQHIAIVVSDMDKAYTKLLKHSVSHISTFPQTLPASLASAAGIKAFYFTDPENHPLELIYFPPGKGAAKWQVPGKNLFLGIDHTAIGVSNTEISKSFYQSLGFIHAGHSENYGTEQEHLNQVFGARLNINGFKTKAGFGVEFLEYITPKGGRVYPAESYPWDLWHYQTEMIVKSKADLDKIIKANTSHNETKKYASAKSVLLRDPDGHAIVIRLD